MKHESCIHGVNHSNLTQNLFKNSSKQENAYTYLAKKDLINVIKSIISRAQQGVHSGFLEEVQDGGL
jgi:hypothetical protein